MEEKNGLLLDCPFCGDNVRFVRNADYLWFVAIFKKMLRLRKRSLNVGIIGQPNGEVSCGQWLMVDVPRATLTEKSS